MRDNKKKKSRWPIATKSKYNINKHNMVVFYKIWKKQDEIQLPTNKMDLNNQKMENHQPSGFKKKKNYIIVQNDYIHLIFYPYQMAAEQTVALPNGS